MDFKREYKKGILEIDSLYEFFERGAALYGEKELYKYNKREGVFAISYMDYFIHVRKMTLALNHLGARGEKVIVLGETSVGWLATYAATVCAGGTIVPIDPGLLEEEMLNFIKLSEAKIVVYGDHFDKIFGEKGDSLENVTTFIKMDRESFKTALNDGESYTSEKYTDYNNVLALGEYLYKNNEALPKDEQFDFYNQDIEKMSVLLFTSGTTGTSKGVMLSQKNLIAVLNSINPVLYHVTETDRLLSVLPVHHTYELSAGMLAPTIYGATICFSDGIKYVSKNIQQFKPTIMTLVPLFINTLHKKVWQSAEKSGRAKKMRFGMKLVNLLMKLGIDKRRKIFAEVLNGFGGELKFLIVGGAALNPQIVKEFRSFGVQVSQGYGITECAPLISVVPLDVYNSKSCGKLMPGMEIRIDKENPTDNYGEIVVKGDNVMLGYYNAPELTAEVLQDGWFRTGDYGYVDKNNYIYITGRKKNIIIASNGKNVFPEEIEEYIERLPIVEEVVVVGRENKETGDVNIVAVVYPNEEECHKAGFTDEETIHAHLTAEINEINKLLVVYKHVNTVQLRSEPFEKTAARKIKRYLVK